MFAPHGTKEIDRGFPHLPRRAKRESSMTQTILVLGMVLLLGMPAQAQSQGAQPPSPPPATRTSTPQQAPPPESDTRSRLRVETRLVIVPVTVKDSEGRLVGDLTKEEFRVFSDDVEQQVVVFTSDPFPLSAVVVIDNDLAQKAAQQVQKSLTTISAGFAANDEVAVVTYDEYPTTVADFSSNNDDLFTKLKRLELGSHASAAAVVDPTTAGPVINGREQPTATGPPAHGSGRYQINNDMDDALYAAGEMLKPRGRDRRKIIFLISDGSDARNNRHGFDETLHTLLAADVSLYAISVNRSLPIGKSLLQHGASEIDKYADRTGGDRFAASKQQDLERLYSEVTEQARNEYTLTFAPQGADRKRDFHPIEVRVRRPGLSVLSRQGYYQSAMSIGR
jgi:VWFA-related protein